MNNLETNFISEMNGRYTYPELLNSAELIKQNNLDLFPNEGAVEELKRQQFILEHLVYAIEATKDNL
jgi:hypothetical protein